MSIHQSQQLIKDPGEWGDIGGTGQPGEASRPLHISEVQGRMAFMLADVWLQDDPYHKAIQESARYLVRTGRKFAEYRTQWTDYITIWKWEGQKIKVYPADWLGEGGEDDNQD